jgi:glutamyl-Q tRNA(Asp) synthetase
MSGGGEFKASRMEPVHDTGAPGTPRYRGRFAPSPTGPLHLGSLTAALGSWLMARHAGGEWIVRDEDLDPPREVAGAAQRQLAALRALGLHPDEPVQRQSDRQALYRAALLTHSGAWLGA